MSAADFLPKRLTLPALREAARECRGCPLYQRATQTVFGEGRPGARVVMIGEQPGDEEDLAGRPFVGPAGRLLDELMDTAGLDRDKIYVTNAVKHFKWVPRGKRRIHQKPSSSEVEACRPWLEVELAAIAPEVLILLGATAAQSLLGKSFRVTKSRGVLFESRWARQTLATVHPSSLLRIPDADDRRAARAEFAAELALVAAALSRPADAPAHR
jgi:uracil-DNA glycosylase family protein